MVNPSLTSAAFYFNTFPIIAAEYWKTTEMTGTYGLKSRYNFHTVVDSDSDYVYFQN